MPSSRPTALPIDPMRPPTAGDESGRSLRTPFTRRATSVRRRRSDVCTYATQRIDVRGSGKAAGRWEPVVRASVYLDHPYATALDHTLNVDLFMEGDARPRHIALSLIHISEPTRQAEISYA